MVIRIPLRYRVVPCQRPSIDAGASGVGVGVVCTGVAVCSGVAVDEEGVAASMPPQAVMGMIAASRRVVRIP